MSACVVSAWDARDLATARAARVVSVWVAWRDGRAGRTGWGREDFSKRDVAEGRHERGRACRGSDVEAGRGDLTRGGRGREGEGARQRGAVEERVGRGRTERAGAARRKNARVAADQDAQRGAAVCDGQIVIGEVMLLSLRFDHRIVDGHVGAAFADEIINLLQDPDALLLNI